MAYTTQAQIEQYLQRTLTANEVSFLTTLLPAIKTWIDKKLNSNFDTASETTRYYDGGNQNLDIDPCNTITAVSSLNDDGTTGYAYDLTTTPEVLYEPRNETVKRELRKRGGKFPHGIQNIAVTALFTEYDGAVPQDIQTIATILASGVINQGKNASSGGNIASESLEGHSVTYDTSDNTIEGVSSMNPAIVGLLEQHRELYVG